ncbi:MAG: TonB-dependent receptor, partial [Terriglobia bacterium]
MLKQIAFGLFLVSLAVTGAFAQEAGQIVGSVRDQSGALIPGATVTITEAGTTLFRSMTTGSNGEFVFPNLRPTSYIVSAEAPSFRLFRQTGVTLLANQSLTINIGMEVGAVTETVNVAGQALQVDTSTSTLAEVVDEARIVELPLNGRDAAKLSTLVAGTIMISTSTETGKGIPGNFYLSANGSGTGQVSYRLDGNTNTDFYFQLNQEFPFPDALQEFSIQTSNFSSQYGNNAGAVVNAVTKSGTNEVHGGAFEFVRNREFNARDFFAPTPDFLKRNQFGAYIGGPVYIPKLYNGKNRTFFFAGWQGTRLRNVNTAKSANGPTVDEKDGNFNTCGSPCTNATLKDASGSIFPNKTVPVSLFDPVAVSFANRLLP